MSNDLTIKEKLKQLLKHGILYGLSSSLQSLLGFIMLPILTQYYTTAEFGVYSILLMLSALSSAIFYFGASSSLGRFYYEEDSDEYRRKVISVSFLITFSGALILVALSLLFSGVLSTWLFNSTQYSTAIQMCVIGNAALNFLLNLMTLILRYQKKSVPFFILMVLSVSLNFSLTYIFLTRYNMGIMAPLYGVLISNGLSFLILFVKYSKFISINIEKETILLFLKFGLQASAAGLFFYVIDWVDRIIIKDLLNLSDVGVYSLGYRIGAVINIILILPFSLIWSPIRMEYSKNSNSSNFTTKIISYYSVVGFIFILITILYNSEIIGIFFKNKNYSNAANVFPIIMLSLQAYGLQGIIDYGIYIQKKVYLYILISVLGIIINISLNYLFIPKFGYLAAAFITLITYVITTLITYLISNKLHPIKVEWSRVISPFFYILFIYSLIYYYKVPLQFKIPINLVSILLFYLFWLKDEEKFILNSKIKTVLKIT